jgi:putative heme-binding domain-containing protein
VQLAEWQTLYAKQFPDSPPAELPTTTAPNKWSYEELLSFLETELGKTGNPTQGALVFRDAQCIKCHRFGGQGEAVGPDLTTVAQRFQLKEILESIVYPSHVISDQYASSVIVADGRTYVGMTARQGSEIIVLTAEGEKIRLQADDVESMEPNSQSAMPEGLLNTLTLDEVAHLMAYLMDRRPASVAGASVQRAR